MIEFILGLFTGVTVGFIVCSCLKVSKDDDKHKN